jgi:chromate transporter
MLSNDVELGIIHPIRCQKLRGQMATKNRNELQTRSTDLVSVQRPAFIEALRFWLKLGFISFGGPTGQIAIMHAELVEKKRWISEERFLHALNFCMLLPGPEAQQLAIYIGWSLHGTWGGVVAGGLFVLPAALILWLLSWLYVSAGDIGWIKAIFYGLQPAVVAIVAIAILRIGRKALRNALSWLVAALAFVAIFFFKTPFGIIILAAAFLGLIARPLIPSLFSATNHLNPSPKHPQEQDQARTPARMLRIAAVCLGLWIAPIVVVGITRGWNDIFVQQGMFFSKAALITFGGAYAVLPYVAQQAVEHYHWLNTSQMMAGLALAETTPGPLIMVLQFVGFIGAWQNPGNLPPLLAATLGAAITTWSTFLPCFLFILVFAPLVDRVRHLPALDAALSTITAAVVGVILNLAVWFGQHVLFPLGQPDFYAVFLALVFFLGLWRGKWEIIPVVFAGGLLGLVGKLLLGV